MSEIAVLSPEALFAALALLTPRAAALCLRLLPSQQLLPPARMTVSDMLRKRAFGALPCRLGTSIACTTSWRRSGRGAVPIRSSGSPTTSS
jgi:hypothetical protein